jgi:hypothetical protein
MKLQVSRGSEARPGRRLSVKLKVGGAAVEVQLCKQVKQMPALLATGSTVGGGRTVDQNVG